MAQSLLLLTEKHYTAWAYHGLFIPLRIEILAVTNKDDINMHVGFCVSKLSFYLRVQYIDFTQDQVYLCKKLANCLLTSAGMLGLVFPAKQQCLHLKVLAMAGTSPFASVLLRIMVSGYTLS